MTFDAVGKLVFPVPRASAGAAPRHFVLRQAGKGSRASQTCVYRGLAGRVIILILKHQHLRFSGVGFKMSRMRRWMLFFFSTDVTETDMWTPFVKFNGTGLVNA